MMKQKPFLEKRDMDIAGVDGFDIYRLPGLAVTKNGTVLAYYEGRRGEGKDWYQELFLYRSEDDGKTWSGRITVIEGIPGEQVHNIFMLAGNKGDEVHCLWNVNHDQLWHKKSTDAGRSWTAPRDITYGARTCREDYPWNVFSVGPGHGTVLLSGRILIPSWFSIGGNTHKPSAFGCIYSDDNGESWQTGTLLYPNERLVNPNEGAVFERCDGSVVATVRHDSLPRRRAMVVSRDGISPWEGLEFPEELPDPICFGSMLRIGWPEELGMDAVLLSNCAWEDAEGVAKLQQGLLKYNWSDDARRNLTVRLSLDGGYNWKYSGLIEEKAGYSDVAVSRDKKTLLCLYEKDWINDNCIFPQKIGLARFNMEWLTGGDLTL